ncbi:MAG TPA: DUF1905 domain-containing protein [Acidimicrobiales bacterium]
MAKRPTLEFSAAIEIVGVNPYVLVDDERATRLRPGWRRPMPVLVRINGRPDSPWRTNMMPVGNGEFYLYLHGGMRKSANAKVNDVVAITLSFDDSYRNGPLHETPDWFGAALASDVNVLAHWQCLAPSRQKEVLRYFAGLKTDDAKKRNLVQVLRVLGGARERFMGRDWTNGS